MAYARHVSRLSSLNALQTLSLFQEELPFSISDVQTDNGGEFLKYFDQELNRQKITHHFTLIHSPRINGCIERFNRTIQEEFLDRTDTMIVDAKRFHTELTDWLSWYNTSRPHVALNYKTPCEFFESC